MTQRSVFSGRLGGDLRLLYQSAIVIFLITVLIGILNGIDAVTFSRQLILTHVHAGTLGWITLAVFASTFWLFGDGAGEREAARARQLTLAAIGAIALYVLAFATGFGIFRPIAGTLTLLVIAGVFAWTVARARSGQVTMTVPRVAMLASLTALLVGAVLGILLGLRIAGRAGGVPEGAGAAHPASLVINYLLLAGMAIVEWHLRGADADQPRATRLGIAQVVLVFTAGLFLMFGLLLDVTVLNILNLPFELAGVVIFLVRLRREIPRISLAGGTARYFGAAGVFMLVNIGLLVFLIANYADDPDAIPAGLLISLDHTMFIGVMTNALVGLLLVATAARRALWPWAEQVVFWSVNAGLAAFVVGLLADSAALKRVGTPVMGLGILLALLVLSLRMAEVRRSGARGQLSVAE